MPPWGDGATFDDVTLDLGQTLTLKTEAGGAVSDRRYRGDNNNNGDDGDSDYNSEYDDDGDGDVVDFNDGDGNGIVTPSSLCGDAV